MYVLPCADAVDRRRIRWNAYSLTQKDLQTIMARSTLLHNDFFIATNPEHATFKYTKHRRPFIFNDTRRFCYSFE